MENEDLERIATDAYFMKADRVKFLLVENLALKSLLHEKGLIKSEEYKEHQKKAAEVLEKTTKSQIVEHLRQMLVRSENGVGNI